MSNSRAIGDVRDIQRSLNICRSTTEKLLRTDPLFPAPITIANKRQWFMDEIEIYKESRPRRIYTTIVAVVVAFGTAALVLANYSA